MATGLTCMEPAPAVATQTEPAPAMPEPAARAAWRCCFAALGSGLLLWMCYHPFALGSVVGWFALAPMLVLVRSQARPRWNFTCALLGGVACFLPALSWMPVADPLMYAAWPTLAL
jgi:hypothetical protein